MRKNLSAYYRPSEKQFEELWRECVFVLDTNVLLGLYRYPKDAYEDLVKVLDQISDRLWVPHQVAVEYQEGRLDVIADQVNKYAEVRNIVSEARAGLASKLSNLQLKKRHSAIDPDSFLSKVERVCDQFVTELEASEKNQPGVSDEDKIRDTIDGLFDGKVGRPLSDDELEGLYAEGKARYEQRRPPGYLDQGKSKSDEAYFHNSLVLRREYGDLIIWHEIINEAASRKLGSLIFVTDDDKEDWWWKQSGKVIGPRPELVDELFTRAGVSTFYMYNSSRFLRFAKEYLGVQVKQESINQVGEIAQFRHGRVLRTPQISSREIGAELAVLEWIRASYPGSEIINNGGYPDFVVVQSDSKRIGFEVKCTPDPRHVFRRGQSIARRASIKALEGALDSLKLVVVVEKSSVSVATEWWRHKAREMPSNVNIIIGVIGVDDKGGSKPLFEPISTITGQAPSSI